MKQRSKRGCLFFLWAICATSAHAAEAQEPQHLSVDLTRPSRTIGSIPFDEPIRVIGVVPAYVERVEPFRVSVGGNVSGSCTPLSALETAGQTWIRPTPARRDTAAPPDTFDLVLDPLRPERNYLLCLRTAGSIPDTMLTRIQKRIAARIDTIVHQIPRTNGRFRDLTAAEATAILASFSTALPPLPAHQEWDKSKVPIFDGHAGDVPRIMQLIAIREPLNDRNDAIRDLNRAGIQLHAALQQLVRTHETPLHRLLDRVTLRDTIAGWPVNAAPGSLHALRFLLRTAHLRADPVAQEALQRVVLGLAPASDSTIVMPDVAPKLDTLWAADAGAAHLARVQATRQSIEGLRSLVSAIALSQGAQRELGIAQPEAQALQRQLDGISTPLFDLEFNARELHRALVERDQTIMGAVRKLSVSNAGEFPVLASTVAMDFNTRAKRYISPDLGVAWAPQLGEAVPYFGVTFFPLGLNRNVVQRGLKPWHSTVGLMLGVTVTSIAKADERKDLFGSTSLLFGGTVRFLDVFRASGGGMALRQLNPGTLSSDAPVRVTYFGALSFDLDVRSLFGGLSSILGGGK